MTTNIEYVFSMKDYMSGGMSDIVSASSRVTDNLLNMNRAYNGTSEVMSHLSVTMEEFNASQKSNPLGKWAKHAFAAVPAVKALLNPLELLKQSSEQAMQFDESMARLKVSAQLDEKEYHALLQQMKATGKKHKVDIAVVPGGFEAIYNEVKDVDLSMQILDASLKGSKAGFIELDEVSEGLVKTLSVLGKENVSAGKVLDTFLAAKRMGNTGFSDLGKYLPGLIASDTSTGIDYKQIAGAFAYITDKGFSPDESADMLKNTMGAFGQREVTGQLEKAGVSVFDKEGNVRNLSEIFTDLSALMTSLDETQKTAVLKSFGLVKQESREAFSVMLADTEKLRQSMGEVMYSDGESDRLMLLSANSMQQLTGVSAQFRNIGLELGGVVLPVISAGLHLFAGVLNIVDHIVSAVNKGVGWWSTQLQEGNGWITAFTGAIIGATAALGIYYALQEKAVIMGAIQNAINGAVSISTKIAAATQWLLNTALMGCPIMWIIGGFALAGAAIALLWNKFDWFRQRIMGLWEVFKEFGSVLFESMVAPIQKVLSGMGALGNALISLIKGDFREAVRSAKEGAKSLFSGFTAANPVSLIANTMEKGNYRDAWNKGMQSGKNKSGNNSGNKVPFEYQSPLPVDTSYSELMETLGNGNMEITKPVSSAPIKDAAFSLSGSGSLRRDECIGTLSDIMQNVRKIAASILIPVALALPGESRATEIPSLQNSFSQEDAAINPYESADRGQTVRIDNITIHIAHADANGEEEITTMVKRALLEALR